MEIESVNSHEVPDFFEFMDFDKEFEEIPSIDVRQNTYFKGSIEEVGKYLSFTEGIAGFDALCHDEEGGRLLTTLVNSKKKA